jgi:GTP-binding protein
MNEQLKLEAIFRKNCSFVAGAADIKAIPPTQLTEFAFVGRSNVGKSSLLNALVYRKSLARVSQNPGCTRQINFFQIDNVAMLADLPGYGYARVSKSEKNKWDNLIYDYLRGRVQLKRVFLLLDSRHEIKPSDINTMNFLDECAVSYQILLTKIDKVSATHLNAQIESMTRLSRKQSACHPVIIATSSASGIGMDEVRKEIIRDNPIYS